MSHTIFSNVWWGLLSKKGVSFASVMKKLKLKEDDDPFDAINEALEPYGCCIVSCGASEVGKNAQLGLAIATAMAEVFEGREPEELPDEMFKLPKDAASKLRRAAEFLGWEWSEPKWRMVAVWCT